MKSNALRRVTLHLLFLTVFLSGCSTERGGGNHHLIALKLQLPASLAKDSNRYRRFLARASHLEIVFVSEKGGDERRHTFAPDQWEALPLSAVHFGDDARDVLTVKAQIWDRQGNAARSYPVLAGRKQLHARDLDPGRPATLVVRLTLQVRPEEFD